MNPATILKLVLAWGALIGPQVYAMLEQYQLQHPNPYLALTLQVLGAGILQLHKPATK